MPRKLRLEEVQIVFKERGCVLLDTDYRGSEYKLKYKCVCGNIAYIKLGNFKQGQLCAECGVKKSSGSKRTPLKVVEKLFEDEGCKLLAKEFKNHHTKMPYICKCGRESSITLANFKQGRRCIGCRTDKLSGINSPFWNHDISLSERKKRRRDPGYKQWRNDVLLRDNFTCQICDETGKKLNVHHIESYTINKNLRTDESNGITLCVDCHKEYHRDFRGEYATWNTFKEFVLGNYREPTFVGEVGEDAYAEYLEEMYN